MQAKYGKIKTLIYRHIPKDLYSFYECIGVKYSGKIISTSSVNNLLSIGHKIIITGTGGIGKSILFKHLLLNSVKETNFIPVLIELRSFNSLDTKEISMHDAIYKILASNGFCLDEKYYDYSLSEGGYLVLLDGFDEINRDRVDKVTSEVKDFCSKYNKNHFIISSRPTDAFIGWNDFSEMSACALTKEQALNLIRIFGYSKELLEQLFENISIRHTRKSDGSIQYHLSLFIKDRYLCNIIRMTCKLNCYSYQTMESREGLEQELAMQLVKHIKKANQKIDKCPISVAFELVDPKELLDVLKWFESQVLFSLSILEKNSDTSISRKRKLSSILEEL